MGYDGGVKYDKPTWRRLDTWRFKQKLDWARATGAVVESPGWLVVLGALMYALTCVAYVGLLSLGDLEGSEVMLVWLVLGLHIAELVIVLCDAVYINGSSVILQMFVIGIGLFNVFAVAGTLGSCLSRDNGPGVAYSVLALGVANLANAQMAAMLFAMFHVAPVGLPNSERQIGARIRSIHF